MKGNGRMPPRGAMLALCLVLLAFCFSPLAQSAATLYLKDLAIGNILVAHGYSNDMFRARQDAIPSWRNASSTSCWKAGTPLNWPT